MGLDDILVPVGSRMSLARGTAVLRVGEGCGRLPWLERGAVRVFRRSLSGREATLYQVGPREICVLAACCALWGLRSPAEATAEGAVDGWRVPAAELRRLFATQPQFREAVLAALRQRLFALIELVEESVFRPVEARLASYLLGRARLRPSAEPPVHVEITHERLAADLWTSREVISRRLERFEREGVVRTERGRIFLRDAAVLERRAARGGRAVLEPDRFPPEPGRIQMTRSRCGRPTTRVEFLHRVEADGGGGDGPEAPPDPGPRGKNACGG